MAVTAFYTFFNQNFARFCSINEFFLVCHCLHTLEYVHSTASSGSAKVVCQSDFSIIYRPFSCSTSRLLYDLPRSCGTHLLWQKSCSGSFWKNFIGHEKTSGDSIVEISLNLVKETRKVMPLLKNRRTDLYPDMHI